MNPSRRLSSLALLVAFTWLAGGLLADSPVAQRTQRITLVRGWNAVFLEVYPLEAGPEAVFSGTPIDLAASYYTRPASAQFVVNPAADLFRKAGWGVRYAPDRPDAFLKSLHAIHGQQAYLVHATRDYVWEVEGSVALPEVQWAPRAFNLVGFPVDAQAPPTFAEFFAGSKAHRHDRIYRLRDGVWRRVTDPTAEAMRSGEAFWIYCDGASKYQGPLGGGDPDATGVVVG